MTTSFSTGGSFRSSNFGMLVVIDAQHHADAALLHEAVDAEAADARRG